MLLEGFFFKQMHSYRHFLSYIIIITLFCYLSVSPQNDPQCSCCPVLLLQSLLRPAWFGQEAASELISMRNNPSSVPHRLAICSECPKAKKVSDCLFKKSVSNVNALLQQAEAAGKRPDSRSESWRRILSARCLLVTSHMKSSESQPSCKYK